jgi:hypothetical protein
MNRVENNKYFWSNEEALDFALKTINNILSNLLRAGVLANKHELFEIFTKENLVTIVIENEVFEIGKFVQSRVGGSESDGILSLNCGNFDRNVNQVSTLQRTRELKEKLVDFLKINEFTHLNLQDLSENEGILEDIAELGYSGVWIPVLIASQGKISKIGDTGLASFWQLGSGLEMLKTEISFHGGLLPRVNNYHKKLDDIDTLQMSYSLYTSYINYQKHEIVLVANTYISPFSLPKTRLENILDTTKNIVKIKERISLEYPEYTIKDYFTGDLNLYGVNSLYGFLGLNVNPWSFGMPLISTLFSGRNWQNIWEIRQLEKSLLKLDYMIKPQICSSNNTIFVKVSNYAPWFLKIIFKDFLIGWQLDFCITPVDLKPEIEIDREPFGSFDHASLKIK